jgi:ATP-dependent RNA helicase DHX29
MSSRLFVLAATWYPHLLCSDSRQVHERDLNTDFFLIILRDLLARQPSLKLVLMSATLNATEISSYFGGCPVISIPGRTHPVEEHRLEDILELTGYKVKENSEYALKTNPARFSKSDLGKLYPKHSKDTINSLSIADETIINYALLAELLEHICLNTEEGAILVFMSGMMEIQKAVEELYKKQFFKSSQVVIYPLHSSLSTAEQTAIFEVPQKGVRKIVISTSKSFYSMVYIITSVPSKHWGLPC